MENEKKTHPFLKKNADKAAVWKTYPIDALLDTGA